MSQLFTCPVSGPKQMVVATDASPYGEAAVAEAMGLAMVCATKLTVVAVLEGNEEYDAIAPDRAEAEGTRLKAHLDAVRAALLERQIEHEIVVHHGDDPARFIIDDARRLGASMIVIGKHGARRGIKRLFVGAVAEKVIADAPCSVLVVRTGS